MALLHVNYHSNVLGMASQIDVILPQRPLAAEQADEKNTALDYTYPVLYLLHGMSDDHTIWQRRTSIERYATDYGVAVVMVEGHLSWYTDMYRGLNYYTHLTEELPAVIHDLFPRVSVKREDTFVAGLSMGGYGAMKLALGRPDRYSAVASLSGALHMFGGPTLGRDDMFWENIFGPLDQYIGSKNDLLAEAGRVAGSGQPKPRVYMWCGLSDSLYGQNQLMKKRLEELDYDLTYEESPGNHSWLYWDEKIKSVLGWLFKDRK